MINSNKIKAVDWRKAYMFYTCNVKDNSALKRESFKESSKKELTSCKAKTRLLAIR